jgi:hypothetical protein
MSPQKISCERRQFIGMIVRPALLDYNVATLVEPRSAQAFSEGRDKIGEWLSWRAAKKADDRYRRLLSTRSDWPRRCATEQTDKLSP